MGHSFINFQEKGYWIPDAIVALIAKYMLVILEKEEQPEWLMKYREILVEVSFDDHPGWQDLQLDEHLTSQEKINDFVFLLKSLCIFLKRKGSYIDVDELNEYEKMYIGVYGARLWTKPVDIDKLIAVINHIENVALKKGGDGPGNPTILSIM